MMRVPPWRLVEKLNKAQRANVKQYLDSVDETLARQDHESTLAGLKDLDSLVEAEALLRRTRFKDEPLKVRYQNLLLGIPARLLDEDSLLPEESSLDLIAWLLDTHGTPEWVSIVWRRLVSDCSLSTIGRLLCADEGSIHPPSSALQRSLLSEFLISEEESLDGLGWVCRRLLTLNPRLEWSRSVYHSLKEAGPIPHERVTMLALVALLFYKKGNNNINAWILMKVVERLDLGVRQSCENLLSSMLLETYSDLDWVERSKLLFGWCFAQPVAVQEILVPRLFAAGYFELSTFIELVESKNIVKPDICSPSITSLFWVQSTITRLTEQSDWNPKGIYHYANTIGIMTSIGLWEISLRQYRWYSRSIDNDRHFNVKLFIDGEEKDVCVHDGESAKLPFGDRLTSMLLACWNDEETAKRVDSFADAINIESTD